MIVASRSEFSEYNESKDSGVHVKASNWVASHVSIWIPQTRSEKLCHDETFRRCSVAFKPETIVYTSFVITMSTPFT